MQEFIGSMVRFSSALTLFGLQQARRAVSVVVESPMSLDRIRQAMDSAADSLSARIDDGQKTTLNSMTTLGADVIARTCDTVRHAVPDPTEVLRNTSEVLRQTTDSCTTVLQRATGSAAKPAPRSGEPQSAADVLAR